MERYVPKGPVVLLSYKEGRDLKISMEVAKFDRVLSPRVRETNQKVTTRELIPH